MNCNSDCLECRNELNLCKLCVKKAKIHCLSADSIKSEHHCSCSIKTKTLWAQDETANNICAQSIKSQQLGATNINSVNLCSQNGTINNLCVNNLTTGIINNCVKWRASATLSSNTLYNLGSLINWDVVIDDPNNNVTLAPFTYTIPSSGYYGFTYHINTEGLTGGSTISGTPIGLLTLLVNGTQFIDLQSVYLSFSNSQSANLGGLILLNAGDIVQMKYEVLVVDPISGLIPYVGTVIIDGNGIIAGQSFFNIHYLSSLNCTPGTTCQPCPPVEIPCTPITIDCDRDNPVMAQPQKQQEKEQNRNLCVSCE